MNEEMVFSAKKYECFQSLKKNNKMPAVSSELQQLNLHSRVITKPSRQAASANKLELYGLWTLWRPPV